MNYPKTRFSVVAAIVCVILLSACGGRDDRLYPYRWMRAGEPFDSLTLALDRKWTFRAPNDSIAGDIGRLMELAADDSTDNVKNARAHFFNARWMMRLGRYGEAQEEFQRALSLTDSASHPYDWRRIMFGLEKYDPRPGLEYYNILVKDIDFLEKVGDNGYLGIRYMDMGGLLNSLGAPERGLEMLEKADSCLALAGWDRMISDNRINKASSYFLLHREDGQVLVCIADNGPGMSEEVRQRVFEKFYQGDVSRSSQGNGLGLALAKRIVDLHDGEISVSTKERKGTTFTVSLPL